VLAFAVNNSVGGKIIERICDLRESFVEVLMVARVQGCFMAGLDANDAVTIQLNFVCPI